MGIGWADPFPWLFIPGPSLRGSNDLAVDSSSDDDDRDTSEQVETCKTLKARAWACHLVLLSKCSWPVQVTWPSLKPRGGEEHSSMAGLQAQEGKIEAENAVHYHVGNDHRYRLLWDHEGTWGGWRPWLEH